MTRSLAQWLVRYRLVLALLSVLLVVLSSAGVRHLYFQSDYQVFFAEENPQLLAHEHIQDTYTKSDNMLFLIDTGEGGVFRREVLESIAWLTEEAWNTPYSVRVDSLTTTSTARPRATPWKLPIWCRSRSRWIRPVYNGCGRSL